MEISASQSLLLENPKSGYLIQRGSVGLYLSEMKDGKPVGQKHFLVSCISGDLIWGGVYEIDERKYVLSAEPEEPISVANLSETQLLRSTGQKYHSAVVSWCEKISGRLGGLLPKAYVERTQEGVQVEFTAGQRFRPKEAGLYRMVIHSGELSPDPENANIMCKDDPNLVFYEHNQLSFLAVTDAVISLTSVRLIESADIKGIFALQRLLVSRFLSSIMQQEEIEKVRFQKRQKQEVQNKQSAISNLQLNRQISDGPSIHDHQLLNALQRLGEQANIEFDLTGGINESLSVDDQLDKICRDSGVRLRHVKLIGEWWNDDVGNILCFERSTEAPYLFLNFPSLGGLRRSYRVYDPKTRETLPLDPDGDLDISEEAYVFIRPLPVETDKAADMLTLARVTYKPFTRDFSMMYLLSLLATVMGLSMPLANMIMVDNVIPEGNRRLLVDFAVGLGCMSTAIFFFSLSQGLMSLRVQTAMTAQMQSMVIDRLLKLPTKFFRRYSSGDLLNRAMMISEISAGFSGTLVSAFMSLLSVLAMLGLCFYYSTNLALLALLAALVTSAFSLTFSFIIRGIALKSERKSGDLFGFMVQMVKGVSKLQIAGSETHAFERWSRQYGEILKLNFDIAKLSQYSSMINMFIQTISTVALYYFAGEMLKASTAMAEVGVAAVAMLTVGTFFAVQGAFNRVVSGIVGFFSTFIEIHQQFAKRELARPILEAEVETGAGKQTPPDLEGLIELSNVSFRYKDDGPLILNNINLRIQPGQFVAFVGRSGCGKSTLFKMLLGFEAPESGNILYDKTDGAKLDMVAVRRQIGVVLQESSVTAGSLFHNIAGASKISMDQAMEAAEDAAFAEDIREMPMGLHTMLPEGGGTLSGGQKQRLMIARSLASNPSIVMFDEATSALDNRTQKIVSDSLKLRKITRLVIAHRLSTIIDADKIIVLEAGKIIEEGDYQELMQLDGVFASMAKRQMASEGG